MHDTPVTKDLCVGGHLYGDPSFERSGEGILAASIDVGIGRIESKLKFKY